jgi:hypothetical protein
MSRQNYEPEGREVEDGMGFSGLAPTAQERRDERQLREAFAKIAALTARAEKAERENVALRAALKGIAEYCSGDDRTLGAIERLISIRNTAERAVRADEQSVSGAAK